MSSKVQERFLRLTRIQEAISRIERYVEGVSAGAFQQNDEKVDAVCMQFIVIGDSVNEMLDELNSYPSEVPWRKIANLRHLLAHHYAKMNPKFIWTIVEDDLGELKATIDKLLKDKSI